MKCRTLKLNWLAFSQDHYQCFRALIKINEYALLYICVYIFKALTKTLLKFLGSRIYTKTDRWMDVHFLDSYLKFPKFVHIIECTLRLCW